MNAEYRQQKLRLGPVPMPGMKLFPDEALRLCKTHEQAMRSTVELAPYNRKTIEAETGIAKPQMSRIMAGERTPKQGDDAALFSACRNVFYLQWLLWRFGFRVVPRDLTAEEKLEIAEAKLAEYEQQERLSA